RVLYQVDERLPELILVRHQLERARRPLEREPSLLDLVRVQRTQIGEEVAEREARGARAGEPAQVAVLLEQRLEPLNFLAHGAHRLVERGGEPRMALGVRA